MSAGDVLLDRIHFATLAETRRRLRTPGGLALVLAIAVPYTFASLVIGEMLLLTPVQGDATVQVVYGSGSQWWNYPGLLVIQPWGVLTLPFFPTVAMVLVSAGVGLGGATGIQLIRPYFAARRDRATAGSPASGIAAGVGPAITGLGTLGACCCTGCAGAAGVAVVAAASGTTVNDVLFNNWYIGVFQVAIVYIALLAQERLLRQPADYCPVPPPVDRRFLAGALLRMALLVAGITWSLAMFVEWGDGSPLAADGPTWYHWIFEHQLLAGTAMAAGLFPKEFAGAVRALAPRLAGAPGRIALLVAGVTWGIGVPPALVGLGLGGTVNEVLGFVGVPASGGGETPDASLGAPLYFHWTFQHVILAAFAIGIGVAPWAATRPLLWTVGADVVVERPDAPGADPPGPVRSSPDGPVLPDRPTAPAAPASPAPE